MVKKLKLNFIRNKFREDGIYVFGSFDLQKYFKVLQNTANLFINRNVRQGNILKLRKDLYNFAGEQISEMLIANRAYEPSYVSFEYALMFYNIIPETVYTITSATTRLTREFVINNNSYSYHHIKREAFTGYIKKDFQGQEAFIAEPEKALADYLYFVAIGQKVLNERLEIKQINKKKLIQYAKLFKRKNLLKLINRIYDQATRPRETIY
jgi:predicted transcriptional regulator of viral defense system